MKKGFEDKFMDLQSGLVSLCLEVTENKVDKIYAYASIEKDSLMFNAFFEVDNKIETLNTLNIDAELRKQFLQTGTMDLVNIKNLCQEYETPTPSEMKMFYDVKTGKYNADYEYGPLYTGENGLSARKMFMNWQDEIKKASNV